MYTYISAIALLYASTSFYASQHHFKLVVATTQESYNAITTNKSTVRTIIIDCSSATTIGNLKTIINTKHGIPTNKQFLTFYVAPVHLPVKQPLNDDELCQKYIKPSISMIELDINK